MTGKLLTTAAATVLLIFCAGCSFMNRTQQIVALTVTPSDATVIANGVAYHNISPQFIEACPSRELLLTVYKPGYRERLYTVDYQLSSTGKVDAWTAILILPFFGLLSDGAWELKETNITLELEPLQPKEVVTAEQRKTIELKQKANIDFRKHAIVTGYPPKVPEDSALPSKPYPNTPAPVAAEKVTPNGETVQESPNSNIDKRLKIDASREASTNPRSEELKKMDAIPSTPEEDVRKVAQEKEKEEAAAPAAPEKK